MLDSLLVRMERNESLLTTASYFWSDAINAFLFKQGPMTPTLPDVLMLTGLNIHQSDHASALLVKPTHRLTPKDIGGWRSYITKHSRTGPITDREHVAFLNMWLERFIFCGKTCGPTSNMQAIAEALANGGVIPLGKHLLGSVYSLLHQVSVKLSANEDIGNLGGPWWFIQLWLSLYTHKAMGIDLNALQFPSDHSEGEQPRLR